jgi:hypothetical protein
MCLQCQLTVPDPGTGFLPRAANCTDGSFCCDNDPSCCAENRGIFLNGLGAIVSTDREVVSTSSSSSTAVGVVTVTDTPSQAETLNSAMSTATSAADTGDNTPSSSSLSTSAKVGIAVGAVAGVIMVVCLVVLLMRRRRARHKQTEGLEKVPRTTPHLASENQTHELGAVPVHGGYTAGGWGGSGRFPPTAILEPVHKADKSSSGQNIHELPN